MRARTLIIGYGIGVLIVGVSFATFIDKLHWLAGLLVVITLLAALIANRFWD